MTDRKIEGVERIAILMPVHNKLEYTKECVKNIYPLITSKQLKNSTFSFVVIDDGSTDGTKEWIAKYYPEIIILEGDGDLWWSGGINAGARYIIDNNKADYVLLWNNDIKSAENYFIELDMLIPLLSKRSIVGSKIYELDPPDTIWSNGGYFNPRSGKRYMISFEQQDTQIDEQAHEVDWLPGMGTLVPVEVINDIGYWDEVNFPQYHGDSDFTYRAKVAGYNIIVYPQLRLWNDKTNSGLIHEDNLRKLFLMLTDTRSNLNLKKNILFYKRHSTSALAYWPLFISYFRLFGGFFKWKLLSVFGIQRDGVK